MLVWITNFLYGVIKLSAPIVYAALACDVTRKAGLYNMSIEGNMLVSALAGVLIAGAFESVWAGLFGAIACGVLIAAIIAYAHLIGKTNLYLTGLAFNTAATGGTVFVMYMICGEKTSTNAAIRSYTIPKIDIPLLKDIPILGDIFSGHYLLTYVAVIAIIAIAFMLKRTRLGLRMRSISENPQAAESVGISVVRIRYISFLISGLLCGLGGAYMSMAYVSFFSRGMVAGRGWIGVSAMNIANGAPGLSSLAALFFGFTDMLSVSLQAFNVPIQFINMIPYVATILALIVMNMIRINNEKNQEKQRLAKLNKEVEQIAK